MRRTGILAATVILLGGASPALAQTFEEAEAAAAELSLGHYRPIAGLTTYAWLARGWSVNTIYIVWTGEAPDRTPHWVVRRVTGDREGQKAVAWADSRRCDAVRPLLEAMETLPPARIDIPGLGSATEVAGIVLDGTNHRLWSRVGRSGPDEAMVHLEVSGNVNSPVAKWWAAHQDALAPCWTADAPT